MNPKRILTLLLVSLAGLALHAAEADSVRVSLITCSPGDEVYSLYGHTAIRCRNLAGGDDIAFNYGVFSFRQPHFVWRFVLGKCDYMVVPVQWDDFLEEYRERGSSVTEQTLNLSQEEARKVFACLVYNCRPENRQYRYNFLFNNCTTKVRDVIEYCVDGRVVYPDTLPHYTYRQMLHQYAARHLWAMEGDDMLLGSGVDTILTARAAMFAPEYLMRYAGGAVIRQENNDSRPLVASTEVILPGRKASRVAPLPLEPLPAVSCLLLLCLAILVLERLSNRMFYVWDVVLLLFQGLVGLLLVFMSLFSQHPGVGSNWLTIPFTPLAFVGIPIVIKAAFRRRYTLWHAFYFAYLTIFMVFSPWIPQDFGNIVVPLALSLLTRPISYYLYYRKNKL